MDELYSEVHDEPLRSCSSPRPERFEVPSARGLVRLSDWPAVQLRRSSRPNSSPSTQELTPN